MTSIGPAVAAAFLVLAASGWAPLWAQQPPPTPETPGTVGDTLKRPEELKRPEQSPVVEPRAPRMRAPAGADHRTVVLHGFRFVGNTVFSAEELLAPVR